MIPVLRVRRFRPSDPVAVALDVVAWGVVHAATGYAVHRIPVERLRADGWLFRPRRVEDGGRLYTRHLRIKAWKDRVPEAGALFAGGISKRHVTADDAGGLERFVVETRRAELGHWLALLAGPLFALWNPRRAVAPLVAYGIAANLPFVAIQRYNRLRATRVLDRRSSRALRTSTSSAVRREVLAVDRSLRTSGRSMP